MRSRWPLWSLWTLWTLVALVVAATTASLDATTDALAHKEYVLRTHMSTKTLYPAPSAAQLARDDAQRWELAYTNNSNATCRPVQLQFVVRHGTRFPTNKDIDRIRATHAKLLAIDAVLPPALGRDWRMPYDPQRQGWLAPAGAAEQIALGARVRQRFLTEGHIHFDADAFAFEHTYKPRTLQSAMGFAHGFFGGVEPVHYASDPIGEDHVLRFFDNCKAFDRSIEHNKTATAHHAAYRTSRQMQRNLRAFRRVVRDTTGAITQKDLEAAYAGCAFDVAVRNKFNEWCALLDEETLLSMDYFQDLKHFYKKSHGHALAFEIAAPLLQDVFQSMRARVDGHSRVQGHFRFAHAETILPLASLLNMSYFDRHASDRDGHFLAETPLDVAKKRSFRGSALAPFSANIGFVLYECDDSATSSYRVQTLLHERTVMFPDCQDQALCPFEMFERMFSQWIHEYDFFRECAVE